MVTGERERERDGGGDGGRRLRLTFGLFGGILAWILHLGGSYAMVPRVCTTGSMALLHVLTVGTALVAAGAVASAWSCLRSGGMGPSAPGGVRPDAARDAAPHAGAELPGCLAMGGVMVSAFFLFLILAEGLPVLLGGDPCAHLPTLDQPIIFRSPGMPGGSMVAELQMAGAGSWFLAGLAHARGLVPPGEAWTTWNPDPWILLGLAAMAGTYLAGVRRLWASAGTGRGLPPWRVGAYLAGIWILVLALVSPIDPLGETLFSVHMIQHMLLMVVAAPLLVLGRPHIGWLWAVPRRHLRAFAALWNGAKGAGTASGTMPAEGNATGGAVRGARSAWRGLTHPVSVLLLHVGALWIWHIPAFYEAALGSSFLHSLEHASFLGTAVLFWWALDRSGRGGRWPGYGAAVLYVFATALQAGALGALLLFAPSPWYPAHAEGAALWGLDLGVDQQLAGAIMWIPGGLVYAAAMALLFVAWMRRSERDGARMQARGWSAPGAVAGVGAGNTVRHARYDFCIGD